MQAQTLRHCLRPSLLLWMCLSSAGGGYGQESIPSPTQGAAGSSRPPVVESPPIQVMESPRAIDPLPSAASGYSSTQRISPNSQMFQLHPAVEQQPTPIPGRPIMLPYARDTYQDDGEITGLAVDIARRVVLAYYPKASRHVIQTEDVNFRRQGDQIHTYARVIWSVNKKYTYASDVFASIVYTPNLRRVYEVRYKDNFHIPMRNFNETSPVITAINNDFKNRDPLMMPTEKLGSRTDLLVPRSWKWRWNPFSGDRDWHVGIAKDRPIGSPLK